ncbi:MULTISPECIES: hypothetical protein [unclassified Streptomyces]|uniref:hypothetical protein n=1 Tax=unclassified Streptomyces TaxID=2593676 RepID=UPI001F047289|nr:MULTISPECIES: hypothetical protein [unclassified Streptomyces]MCH0564890.1 hypothetical protein [Streptomyces sp. MUM 2J]MCH0571079.1 hypothetical protein [Streptomyces sp. MUM 136J]
MSTDPRDFWDPSQPRSTRTVPAPPDTRPWYLRWGAEAAGSPTSVCHPSCTGHPGDFASTDLFCPENSFLPLSSASSGMRRVVLTVSALLLPTSVNLSARWHSSLPLLALALGCAALFTLAPLRLYPTTRRVAAVLLLLAGVVGAVARWGGDTARMIALTSALGVSALLWAWCAGRIAWHGGRSGIAPRTTVRGPRSPAPRAPGPYDRHEAWMLPGALAFGAATGALPALMVEAALRHAPDGWLWDPPQAVRLWLARTPWLSVLGALLTAVLAGCLHGVRTFDPAVTPLFPRLRPLPLFEVPRPRWRLRPVAGSGALDRLVLIVDALTQLLVTAAAALGLIVLNILVVSAELLLRALVVLGNLLWRCLVSTTRLLVSVLVRALGVLAMAAVLGGGALLRSVRVAVAPLALLGVQLVCAWSFAVSGSAYQETGALDGLTAALGAPLLGYTATVTTWSLWCGERLRRCLDSASRSGQHVAIWTAVLVPATSWLVCAPYVITGQGAVRPGLICYSSTALLAGALVLGLANRRRSAGKRAG